MILQISLELVKLPILLASDNYGDTSSFTTNRTANLGINSEIAHPITLALPKRTTSSLISFWVDLI